MAKTDKKKVKLSDAEVFAKATRYLVLDTEEKTAKKGKSDISEAIAADFEARKIQTKTGRGLRVTRVQNETVQYDEDGLYEDLAPTERPHAFDYFIDLSVLGPEREREVQKIVRDALTRTELEKVRKHRLNVVRLSEAVQAGKIAATKVAVHSTIVKAKAFIRVTPAGEDS